VLGCRPFALAMDHNDSPGCTDRVTSAEA